MDCVSCREVIQRSIDGELNDGQVVEFQQHLSFCGDCAAELQEIAGARAVLRATREVTVDVPAGFADRVMATLEAQPEPSSLERALSAATGGVLPGRVPRRIRHYAYYGVAFAAVVIGLQRKYGHKPGTGEVEA
jgi:anti-sigma factor RsiW